MLEDYYIRAHSGELVPLGTLVGLEHSVEPSKRTQFQQLNSLTVEGIMTPGVPMGGAVGYWRRRPGSSFRRASTFDYKGELAPVCAAEQRADGDLLPVAVVIIYLVLAAQFESWRDPAIILVSVPMSIAGAMAFITLGFASMNIYTQVGLITLIGVVAKNGILIVEFANQLQIRSDSQTQAVEQAASIRLRPIIMTSAALIVAMVPLLTASGPGAVSRFHIGLTIATGLGIGTLFTLFVLPAFYLLLARDHNKAEQELEADAKGV